MNANRRDNLFLVVHGLTTSVLMLILGFTFWQYLAASVFIGLTLYLARKFALETMLERIEQAEQSIIKQINDQ